MNIKKFAIVGAMALGSAVAYAETVESANIVGYTTYSLKAKAQDIMGAPFVSVGEGDFSIQNISLDNGTESVDWVMIFDPATRTYVDATWYPYSYAKDDADWATDLGPGWTDQEWRRVDYTLKPGQGLWIYTDADCNVTVPGQLATEAQNKFGLKAKAQAICATMFPVTTSIQDIKLSNGTESIDWIMIFDPTTRSYVDATWYPYSYAQDDADWATDLGAGWTDQEWRRLNYTLKPGQGFWIYTEADCDVSFTNPL